jgi:hypothetical protein
VAKMMDKNHHILLKIIIKKVIVIGIKVFNLFLAIKNHKKEEDPALVQIVVHKQSNHLEEKIVQKQKTNTFKNLEIHHNQMCLIKK